MKPIKSLLSRDSVSGERSQSHGCRPVACELLELPLGLLGLVLHLCVDVDWSDTGQESGV